VPEHPNVQRIRSAYDAFAAADLTAALKDLAPDAVFHFNGSGPLSGDHTGIDEIRKHWSVLRADCRYSEA
jgi:ketosteroid isomerase-like protein